MSKVITHTHEKIVKIKKGEKVRTKHNHFPMGKTGYVPVGTNKAINIEVAKRK